MTHTDPPAWTPSPAPVPAAPARPAELSSSAERVVAASLGATRGAVLTALRQLGCVVKLEQLSMLEAERGSRLGGLTLSADKVPLAVRVDVEPVDGAGSRLVLRVRDRWGMPVGRTWGAVSAYRTAFTQVAAALDAALGRLDPAAAARFEPWEADLGEDVAAMQSAADVAQRAQRAVTRRTDRVLEGSQARPTRGAATVRLVNADRVADLDAEVVDAVLTTGQLVAARPGGLPGNLLADVQAFVIALEAQLGQAAGRPAGGAPVTIEVADAHVPVVGFLAQQASLRERLPLRLRLVCTTCRLEKVVNPDLARLRERGRRTQILTSSVGLLLGHGGMSPYLQLGRMVSMRKGEPDFVCPRCQGLDADEAVVTFCPGCGDRRDESVLRVCPTCQHDFRVGAPAPPAWQALPAPEPAPEPEPEPVLAASLPPAGWFADPFGRFEIRYWDGAAWSEHVGRAGVVSTDPPR